MIVCLGTTPALSRTMEFDELVVDGVNRACRVYDYPAGKAVNAARAAATLYEQVISINPVGGTAGDRFISLVRGFKHAFVEVSAEMRMCVTVVDRRRQSSTELIEESPPLELRDGEQLLKILRRRVEEADAGKTVVVLAGSIARGLSAAFYAECIAAVHAAGGRVILDATGEPLRLAIEERPEVVKINAGELEGLYPATGTVAGARAVAVRTGGWVIITRGADSTFAIHADGRGLEAHVPRVEVVSAIGSGDSFAGGFAAAMVRGLAIEESLALATACASANAMTADAAHFSIQDVERLQAQVRVVDLPAASST